MAEYYDFRLTGHLLLANIKSYLVSKTPFMLILRGAFRVLWIVYVFSVLCLLCLSARLFICALWSPAGKGLTSWLSFVV